MKKSKKSQIKVFPILFIGFIFSIILSLFFIYAGSFNPSDTRELGYEFLDSSGQIVSENEAVSVHIWNKHDDYFFNKSSGIQFSNYFQDYWTTNILCGGYKNSSGDWVLDCNNVFDFNWTIYTDNSTFVNYTGYRETTMEGETVGVTMIYNLKENDGELNIYFSAESLSGAIPADLGFVWKTKDIGINNTPYDDYIRINDTNYLLSDDLDLEFSNLQRPLYKLYDEDYYIKLTWDSRLNGTVSITHEINETNSDVELLINVGPLKNNEKKETLMYWKDPYQETYGDIAVYRGATSGRASQRLHNASGWQTETTETTDIGEEIEWIKSAHHPTSEEAIFCFKGDSDSIDCEVWSGSSWSDPITLGTGAVISPTFAVCYERSSGYGMVFYSDYAVSTTAVLYAVWNGTGWESTDTEFYDATPGKIENMRCYSDPGTDYIGVISKDDDDDCWSGIWDGSSVEASSEIDTDCSVDDEGQTYGGEWETQGHQFIIAYYADGDHAIDGSVYTKGGSYVKQDDIITDIPPTEECEIQLEADPTTDLILLTVADASEELEYNNWSGSAWGTPSQLDSTIQGSVTGLSQVQQMEFYSDGSGAIVIYGQGTNTLEYQTYSGGSWSGVSNVPTYSDEGIDWVITDKDSYTNKVMLTIVGTTDNVASIEWNGTGWEASWTTHETAGNDQYQTANFEYDNEDERVPTVSLDSPTDETEYLFQSGSIGEIYFNASFTGELGLSNSTLYIWNSTDYLVNTTLDTISGTSNVSNISVTLDEFDTYTWNYLVIDDNNNQVWGDNNLTVYVTEYGWLSVSISKPDDDSDWNQYDSNLTINTTVTCNGGSTAKCGEINAYARYNLTANPDTLISTTSGADPFYVVGSATTSENTTLYLQGIGYVLVDGEVQEGSPTAKGGSAGAMELNLQSGFDEHDYIMFDISMIPSGATIEEARLKLYQYGYANVAGDNYNVIRMYKVNDFVDGSSGGTPLTEASFDFSNSPCQDFHGDGGNTSVCNLSYYEESNTIPAGGAGWINFTATEMVTKSYEDSDENVTFFIINTEGGKPAIYTKEATADGFLLPMLEITYSSETENPGTVYWRPVNWTNEGTAMTGLEYAFDKRPRDETTNSTYVETGPAESNVTFTFNLSSSSMTEPVLHYTMTDGGNGGSYWKIYNWTSEEWITACDGPVCGTPGTFQRRYYYLNKSGVISDSGQVLFNLGASIDTPTNIKMFIADVFISTKGGSTYDYFSGSNLVNKNDASNDPSTIDRSSSDNGDHNLLNQSDDSYDSEASSEGVTFPYFQFHFKVTESVSSVSSISSKIECYESGANTEIFIFNSTLDSWQRIENYTSNSDDDLGIIYNYNGSNIDDFISSWNGGNYLSMLARSTAKTGTLYCDYASLNVVTSGGSSASNPISVGTLNSGDSYSANWTLNVTTADEESYLLDVLFNSSYGASVSPNNTDDRLVNLNPSAPVGDQYQGNVSESITTTLGNIFKGLFDRDNDQSITTSPIISRLFDLVKRIVDSLSLTVLIDRLFTTSKSVTDTLTFVLNFIATFVSVRNPSQDINLDDSLNVDYTGIRGLNQDLTITNLVKRFLLGFRDTNQQITLTDSIDRTLGKIKNSAVTVTLSNSVTRFYDGIRNNDQSISLSDIVNRLTLGFRNVNDQISITDSATRSRINLRTVSQDVSIDSIVNRLILNIRNPNQAITITDIVNRLSFGFIDTSQDITLTDQSTSELGASRVSSQDITLADIVNKLLSIFRTQDQDISLETSVTRQIGSIRTQSQSISIEDIINRLFLGFRSTSQNIILDFSITAVNVSGTQEYSKSVTESLSIDSIVSRIILNIRKSTDTINLDVIINRLLLGFRNTTQDITIDSQVVSQTDISRVTNQDLTITNLVNRLLLGFRNTNQQFTIEDSIDRKSLFISTQYQSMSIDDIISRLFLGFKVVNQDTTISSQTTVWIGVIKSVSQDLSVDNIVNRLTFGLRSSSQQITLNDFIGRVVFIFKKTSQDIQLTETSQRDLDVFRDTNQGISISDFINKLAEFIRKLTNSITITETINSSATQSYITFVKPTTAVPVGIAEGNNLTIVFNTYVNNTEKTTGATINNVTINDIEAVFSNGELNRETSYNNPSATGDDYNDWGDPTNAFSSDGNYATEATQGNQQDYYNFSLSIPSWASNITGIEVIWEGKASVGTDDGGVELSGDGGSTYTSTGQQYSFTTGNDQNGTFGNSSYLWGREWSVNNLSNSSFRVRIELVSSGALSCDTIFVKVYYTVDSVHYNGTNWLTNITAPSGMGSLNDLFINLTVSSRTLTKTEEDSVSKSGSYSKSVSESLTLDNLIDRLFIGTLSIDQSVNMNVLVNRLMLGFRDTNQVISLNDVVDRLRLVTGEVNEQVSIDEIINRLFLGFRVQTETIDLIDYLNRLFSGIFSLGQDITISEGIGTKLISIRTQTQSISINDLVNRLLLGFVNTDDSITITSNVGVKYSSSRVSSQSFSLGNIVNRLFLGYRTESEAISISLSDSEKYVGQRFTSQTLSITNIIDRLLLGFRDTSQGLSLTISQSEEYINVGDTYTKNVTQSISVSELTNRLFLGIRETSYDLSINNIINRQITVFRDLSQLINFVLSVVRSVTSPTSAPVGGTGTSTTIGIDLYDISVEYGKWLKNETNTLYIYAFDVDEYLVDIDSLSVDIEDISFDKNITRIDIGTYEVKIFVEDNVEDVILLITAYDKVKYVNKRITISLEDKTMFDEIRLYTIKQKNKIQKLINSLKTSLKEDPFIMLGLIMVLLFIVLTLFLYIRREKK